MSDAHSSGSSQASFVQTSQGQASLGPLCKCGISTTILKAWTNDNSGRRFYRCVVHGFVSWADAEKPHGWQMISLLEARDEINRYRGENKVLKESLKTLTHQLNEDRIKKNLEFDMNHEEEKKKLEEEKKKLGQEKKKLEFEDMVAKERETISCTIVLLLS